MIEVVRSLNMLSCLRGRSREEHDGIWCDDCVARRAPSPGNTFGAVPNRSWYLDTPAA